MARILDANANRAREALRVLEDYARFALDDAELALTAKTLRHSLATALQNAGAASAIIARDTPGDVGTTLAVDSEYTRTSAADVVLAAGKRLSEALRALEEFTKTCAPAAAAAIEQIRYRGYDLEKRLAQIIRARTRLDAVRLYVLITPELCRRPWDETVRACVSGGADCLQLRAKNIPDGQLFLLAAQFVRLCRELRALAIINDRPDVAAACAADGVHVGQDDLPVSAARRVVGPDLLIGASSHSAAEARALLPQGPDYVAVGPMFASTVKPEYRTAGPATLQAVRALTALPLVPIGGITAGNLAAVVQAGGRRVCVCTAIIAQDDPAAAARAIRTALLAAEAASPRPATAVTPPR